MLSFCLLLLVHCSISGAIASGEIPLGGIAVSCNGGSSSGSNDNYSGESKAKYSMEGHIWGMYRFVMKYIPHLVGGDIGGIVSKVEVHGLYFVYVYCVVGKRLPGVYRGCSVYDHDLTSQNFFNTTDFCDMLVTCHQHFQLSCPIVVIMNLADGAESSVMVV